MVFGELELKTYPPTKKGLKYSSMFPPGERNLLMEPPIGSRKHMVPQNWSPKLGCPGNKRDSNTQPSYNGRPGVGKSNQGGPGKKGLGCLGETWFSAKRTGWVAPWRLGLGAEKGTKPQPSYLLDQGKGLHFFHHLPCL
jgi:hypothetical protein